MQDGYTPLILAAERDDAEMAALLLVKGADMEAKTNVRMCKKTPPLHGLNALLR